MNIQNEVLSERDYRNVLKKVFILHVVMFIISFYSAIVAQSSSVLADSLDFIGDAISYALSIFILSRSLLLRSMLSIAKAITMISFGLPVMAYATMRYISAEPPEPHVMSIAGMLGVITHIYCIKLLWKFRDGDSNRLSVWICTINDLLSNVLTIVASYIVFKTSSVMPDLIVAMMIVAIAICGAVVILRQAIKELKQARSQNIEMSNV